MLIRNPNKETKFHLSVVDPPHLSPRKKKQQKAKKNKKESAPSSNPPFHHHHHHHHPPPLCWSSKRKQTGSSCHREVADREDCCPGEPQDRCSARNRITEWPDLVAAFGRCFFFFANKFKSNNNSYFTALRCAQSPEAPCFCPAFRGSV